MSKGERFIICMDEDSMLGERAQRHVSRGSMRNMTLVLHRFVSINSKGGYLLLIGLVVIDVNP
jgi:hypothetical protein